MKKSRLLIAPLLVVPLMVSCGGGSKPDPKPEEYTVGSNTNGLTISVTKATKGQDFKAELSIDTTQITDDVTFPKTLSKLTSGNKTLSVEAKEYTYTPKDNDKKADLFIPAASVLGNIDIKLEFEKIIDYTVTKEEFNNAIAFKGIKFMQEDYKEPAGRKGGIITGSREFSDTIYHNSFTDPRGNNELFCENANGKYYSYNIYQIDPPVYIKGRAEQEQFLTPESISFSTRLDSFEIGYEDFQYDESEKIYKYTDPSDPTKTLNFGFINKKLVSYDGVGYEPIGREPIGTETDSFEYKQTTPKLPLPENVIENVQIKVGDHSFDGFNTINLTHGELVPDGVKVYVSDIYDNPIEDANFSLTPGGGDFPFVESLISKDELMNNHKIKLVSDDDTTSHELSISFSSEGYRNVSINIEVNYQK